jgi:predicted enzyme related to lactoylglutathione lyase
VGEITYWFFSFFDNRFSYSVVGYGPGGTIVKGPTEKPGARYVSYITVNNAAHTVTAVGQAGYSVTMNWSEFLLP